MDPAMTALTPSEGAAGDAYLLLADISGYAGFLASVGEAHGVDFAGGIPAGYAVLGALLNTVVQGVQPHFTVAKLEGDAVFATSPARELDGEGTALLRHLAGLYSAFRESRSRARVARDHICTACPNVAALDLKMILHRGAVVRQAVGPQYELLGPAVNVAHRLLKNGISARLGPLPYLFVTDAAGERLGLPESGLAHVEEYPDVGTVSGEIFDLARA